MFMMTLIHRVGRRWTRCRGQRVALFVRAIILFLLGAVSLDVAGATPLPVPLPRSEATAIVYRAYADILGREPDPGGMATYAELLAEGGRDETWLRETLRRSPERQQGIIRFRKAVTTTLTLAGIWAGLLLVFQAYGDVLARRVFGRCAMDQDRLDGFQKIWLGLGLVMTVLQFWSLIWPVDSTCLVLFLAGGLGAMADQWRAHRNAVANHAGMRIRRWSFRDGSRWVACRWTLLLVAVVGVILVASAGTARPHIQAYDTLLYHLNWVRWQNTFPVVPGLANLHIRLGTNSAWLLLASLLDNGPLDARSAWVMPGFASVLFCGYLLHRVLVATRKGICARLTALLLLPYAVARLFAVWPSLYSDDPAQFALAVCVVELIGLAERRFAKEGVKPVPRDDLAVCAVCGYLAFVIKPIAAPTVALISAGLLYAVIGQMKRGLSAWRRVVVTLLPVLLPLGWMLRNAVLTGWLLFPAAVAPLPVDWAVPRDPAVQSHDAMMQSVRGQKDIIQAWARRRGALRYHEAIRAPLRAWVPDWFAERRGSVELRWLLPMGGAGILVGLGLVYYRRRDCLAPATVLSMLLAIQLTFWFLSAPDLRFGSGLFWIWMAWGLALPISLWWERPAFRCLAGIVVAIPVLAFAWDNLMRSGGHIGKSPWWPGRAASLPVTSIVLANGQTPPLEVNVPVSGDRTGDSELPSTPYPSDHLLARVPGSIRHGFRVDDSR